MTDINPNQSDSFVEMPSEKLKTEENVAGEVREAVDEQLSENSTARLNTEKREYSEVLRPSDVVSIPDVHGDIDALRNSLIAQGVINRKEEWIAGNTVVQMLGDYIDRGSSNLEVLNYLLKIKHMAEEAGGRIDFLAGNHETIMLLATLEDPTSYDSKWVRVHLMNGGSEMMQEVREAHGESEDEDYYYTKEYKILRDMFFGEGGKYNELLKSLKVCSQVDDVLYVHAGLNGEWADILASKGIDGLNASFQDALQQAGEGDNYLLKQFNSGSGPLWVRYMNKKKISESEIARVAQTLKMQGINAVVIGHDKVKGGPRMHDIFAKYGIKFIGSDVGMSSGYRGDPGQGGTKIDTNGNIVGLDENGPHDLHREENQDVMAA